MAKPLIFLCLLAAAFAAYQQIGGKIVGSGAFDQCFYGGSVALSSTADVLAVGGPGDYSDLDGTFRGAIWVYVKQPGYWQQQGAKLMGSGAIGDTTDFGRSVSLNKNGDVLVGGCPLDNDSTGAVWVFVQQNGAWSQQGNKIVGTGTVGRTQHGISVSLSSVGDILAVGGLGDNAGVGAVWIYAAKNNVWSQQGNKLVGSGSVGAGSQGASVALSSGGDVLAFGGSTDNAGTGAVWVFAQKNGLWSQQGSKLVGTGSFSGEQNQGGSVSLSSNGTILAIGGAYVSSVWIFIQGSNGIWSQVGAALSGAGAVGSAGLGFSLALNSAGNVVTVGGPYDNSNNGAVWVFGSNSSGQWVQQGDKLIGGGAQNPSSQGFSVAITSVADYIAIGGRYDNGGVGAVWLFGQVNTTKMV